jgi:PAS domain S-box-containing protein
MSKNGAEGRSARASRSAAALLSAPPTKNERDLQRVVDSIPAMAWSARADGTGNFFNRRYLDYVGLSAGQLEGWQWTSVVHPDDVDRVMACWEAFNAAGSGGEIEARLRRHDGVYRWFSFRSSASPGADGKIAQWYGVNIDIEDQKRTAIMLAGERRLLELVASSRPIRDVILALCEVIEEALPGCRCEIRTLDLSCTIYEHAIAPSLPRAFVESIPGTPLDGDRSPSGTAAIFKTQIISRDVETDLRWQGSAVRDQLLEIGLKSAWSAPISASDRRVLGTLCIYQPHPGEPRAEDRDIVGRAAHIASIAIERYRAEDELRRRAYLLATAERISQTGSFHWDMNKNKLVWSAEMYRIHEMDEAIEPRYPDVLSTVHPDDFDMIEGRTRQSFQGIGNPDDHYRILLPDGRVKYLKTAYQVIRHPDGRIESVGVAQDVTRQRVAEDALDQLRSELAHVTRVTSLGELAASIAHEVNQPLSGIITNASTCLRLLAADPPNIDGAVRTAQRSVRDANRASEVVRRLRSLYRKQDFTPEPFDLNEAAREVFAICAHDLQRRRIILSVGLDDALPHVNGDRIQLQQVILNLILNAADALGDIEGRPRQIGIRSFVPEPGRVQLEVSDTGVGIPAEDCDRIFEPFRTTKPNGMGIGLSVSRSIIDRHKGSLWAMASEGPGATIAFSLPAASDTEA